MKIAQGQGLDLVEISPGANPPVCKIIDYNKFLYDEKKKKKEMKAKAKTSEVKEIRFTPNTDDHDFEFKVKHAEKFLLDGDKVKAHVQFKGRAIMFKERGELLLLKFADRLKDVGALEGLPKMEGKRMLVMFAPKAQQKQRKGSHDHEFFQKNEEEDFQEVRLKRKDDNTANNKSHPYKYRKTLWLGLSSKN
jgi:translation initiation factor IF-3